MGGMPRQMFGSNSLLENERLGNAQSIEKKEREANIDNGSNIWNAHIFTSAAVSSLLSMLRLGGTHIVQKGGQ